MLTVGLSPLLSSPVYFSHSVQCTPYYIFVQLILKLFSKIQESEDSSFASKLYSSSTTVASSTILVIMHYINKIELNCKGLNCSSSLGSKHSLKMGPTVLFPSTTVRSCLLWISTKRQPTCSRCADHDWKQVYIFFFFLNQCYIIFWW